VHLDEGTDDPDDAIDMALQAKGEDEAEYKGKR